MADNGVTFGFGVELEADSGSTNVDENSIWASGGFGKLEFGNNDGAEDTFAVNGSNSGVDYGGVGNPTATFLTWVAARGVTSLGAVQPLHVGAWIEALGGEMSAPSVKQQ